MCAADVFEMVLSGQPAVVTSTYVNQLPPGARQDVLCTVCGMHDEIARNCVQTATEVSALLEVECSYYVNGVATCLLK